MYGYNAGLRRSRRVNESIVLCYSFLEKYQFSCKISGLLFTWFTCFDVMYGLHYNVLLELTIIQEVKGLTEKLYAYALARMKTCSHAKFQVPNCYGY